MTKRRVDTKGFLGVQMVQAGVPAPIYCTSMTQAMHQLHTCYHIYCRHSKAPPFITHPGTSFEAEVSEQKEVCCHGQ